MKEELYKIVEDACKIWDRKAHLFEGQTWKYHESFCKRIRTG